MNKQYAIIQEREATITQHENSMKEFSNYERVKKIRILPRSFTIENGELTPKLSIVKKVVFQNFDKEIEQIYSEE